MNSDSISRSGDGWGKLMLFPIAAAVIGMGGGFGVGRGLRRPSAFVAVDSTAIAVAHAAAPVPLRRAAPVAPTSPSVAAPSVAAPSPSPSAAPAPPAPGPEPLRPTSPRSADKAVVHLRSVPPGAEVKRSDNGQPLGVTPVDVELLSGSEPLTLTFEKKGYTSTEQKLIPRGEISLNVPLISAAKQRHKKTVSKSTTIDPFN